MTRFEDGTATITGTPIDPNTPPPPNGAANPTPIAKNSGSTDLSTPKIPQPWLTAAEPLPPRVAQHWVNSFGLLESAMASSFKPTFSETEYPYAFSEETSPHSATGNSYWKHWQMFECSPLPNVGVLVHKKDIIPTPPPASASCMKLQGKSNKIKGSYSPPNVERVPQLAPGQASLWLEYIPVKNHKTQQYLLHRALSDSGSNVDLVDNKTAIDMQFPVTELDEPMTSFRY